jgi:hypothetical protein
VILPPSLQDVVEVLKQFRQLGTLHEVKAKGTDEDEAELREHQREVKRRSRARRVP